MKKIYVMIVAVAASCLLLLSGCQKVTVSGKLNGHKYVDLGLPSGTLWATCNVGASNPEDDGNYYAWGETRTKGVYYGWDNYKYGQVNDGEIFLNKYCSNSEYGVNGFTDNLRRLVASDDAATVNWGEGWRTPTNNEFYELVSECSWEETTYCGTIGILFTGINGNSVFLPTHGNEGYWSSMLDTENPYCACFVYLHSDSDGAVSYEFGSCGRCEKWPVRPVCSLQ